MDTRIHTAPKIYKQKNKKKITTKRIIIGLLIFFILYFSLFLLVVPERPDKPFFQLNKPLVIAHRGGASLAPENTLVAFEKARKLGVDAIELDVQMTKDGHLVVIHDETVERTTNGEGEVKQLTLAQIKQLDAAYRFQDIRGRYIYRGQGIQIPTLEEVFQQFGDMHIIIDIKEADYSHINQELEKHLWELIERYHMQDKVLIYSFSEEIITNFDRYAQGQVALGAPRQEVTRFVFYHKLFLNRLYRPQTDAFLVQPQVTIFNLKDKRLIDGSERLNMDLYYWTIDDEQEMRALLERGAHGIITSRPDLLLRVIHEMEVTNGEN